MRPQKKSAHPGGGNARTSGTSQIINNIAHSISAIPSPRKYPGAEMSAVTATDPADSRYGAIAALIVLARAATALLHEGEVR
jgi:hypothetical protein